MSNASVSYLSTLPVELLHRIFDNLDVSTLVFSLRLTCRRLKLVTDDYDRYRLDFSNVSRWNFQRLCHRIDPRKVISVTLAPREEITDQIELFTNYFRAGQFKRLHSLTLINVKEKQLKNLLKRFDCSSLISFSFKLGQRDCRCRNTTIRLLSSIVTQVNLKYLDIGVNYYSGEKISWASQSAIKYLTLEGRSNLEQISTILQYSPHLQVLKIESFYGFYSLLTKGDSSLMSFPQVISLTLNDVYTSIQELELFISMMCSLSHLKIVTGYKFMDGNRWEQFIQGNLPHLNRFELFIRNHSDNNTSVDPKAILASFQTSFWLEHKKWLFTCEHTEIDRRCLILYSLPICVSSLNYLPQSAKTSLSTWNPVLNENQCTMNDVKTIQLSLENLTLTDINQALEDHQTSNNVMFPKVTKLELTCYTNRKPNCNQFIATLVDLSRITEMKFTGRLINEAHQDTIDDFCNLLQQTRNLISLQIGPEYRREQSALTAREICAMTPSHVKHLTTSIQHLNEARIVLEKCPNLSTVKFSIHSKSSTIRSFIEWLEENRPDSSHFICYYYTMVWLGRTNNQSTTAPRSSKRIKLADEHNTSDVQ